MNNLQYLEILKCINEENLNKIYKGVAQKGFKVDGFSNLNKAPLVTISAALNRRKKQAPIFLKEIAKTYNIDNELKKLNGEKLSIENVGKVINAQNRAGVVSALLLENEGAENEEKIIELLSCEYREVNIELEGLAKEKNKHNNSLELSNDVVKKYICKFEKGRDDELFFIKPVLILENDKIIEIDDISIFGSTGKMKISFPKNIKEKQINEYKYFTAKIDENDIYLFNDDDGERKAQIYENKIQDIKELDEENIYEILKLPEGIHINEFKIKNERLLRGILRPVSNNILIESKNKLYGPFNWRMIENGIDVILTSGKYYVFEYDEKIYENDIYFLPAERTYDENKRIIRSNSIFNGQPSFDFIDDNSLKDLFSKWLGTSRKDKNVIRNKIKEIDEIDCTNERKKRIEKMFKSLDLVDDMIDDLLINILDDKVKIEQLVSKIINNTNYFKKIEQKLMKDNDYLNLLKEIDNKKIEKEDLLAEIEEINKNMNNKLEKDPNKKKDKLVDENIKLENYNKELEEKIKTLKEEKKVTEEYIELKQKIIEIKKEHETTSRMKGDLEDEIYNITSRIRKEIINTPINGMIASKMLSVASEYEKDNKSTLEVNVAQKSLIKDFYNESNEKLISHVYHIITKKAHRDNFTRNDIINILICVSQGFLTIFAGKPGTGKTSLCEILARTLGIYREDKFKRYTEVSVEKGWTSKRDFIGYYNPLTKKFDKNNINLFNAFTTLDKEARMKINDFPYFILLDEANLSSMEHYWADFMNVCDFDKKERCINLSEEHNFKISNTLRFLATINYDHTTEVLSPRLLDRGWIILLNDTIKDLTEIEEYEFNEILPMVSYDALIETFSADKERSIRIEFKQKLLEIQDLFLNIGVPISTRVLKAIKQYCIAGESLFDDSENSYVALDYAVSQKILPLISGYGESYKNFLLKLQEICDKSTMPKCNEIIKNIIRNGENNMLYYQFFI